MRIKWNNIDNVYKDYLVSLNEEQTKGVVSRLVENIDTISKFSAEFYIGKTGDPVERMFGGRLSENVESLYKGHHLETGYKSLYLLLNSKNRVLIEVIEESLLEIFYKYHNNGNTKRFSPEDLKETDDYYIYVAVK